MATALHAVAFMCLHMRSASTIQMSRRADSQCSAGSPMFAVPSSHHEPDVGFTVVMMADYPSAGSSWLRHLLGHVSTAEALGSPTCSVESPFISASVDNLPGVHCNDPSWSSSMGSMLVKSHFPVRHVRKGLSFDDWMFAATMNFDKLLMLVRHPVSLLASYKYRWSYSVGHLPLLALADNLQCWASWWELVRETVDTERFYMLRYEDLCRNTSQGLFGVLQFLGGRYAEILLDSVHRALSNHSLATCIHLDELDVMSAVKGPEDKEIVDKLHDFMLEWGYTS